MQIGVTTVVKSKRRSLESLLASALALLVFPLVFFSSPTPGKAIPAFARKYGLPCSACHEAWPMLNLSARRSKTTATN